MTLKLLLKLQLLVSYLTMRKTDPKLLKKTYKNQFMRHQRDVHFTCCTRLTSRLVKNYLFNFSVVLFPTYKT